MDPERWNFWDSSFWMVEAGPLQRGPNMPDTPEKDLHEMVVSLGKPKRPRGHRAKNCGISMVEHGNFGNTLCLKFHSVGKD